MPVPVVITLFGGMHARSAAGDTISLPGQKDRALLGYLAASLGRPCARSKIAMMLWGEREDRQARDSLKQALWHLRQAFLPISPALIVSDRQSASVDESCARVDVAEFCKLLDEGTQEAADRAIDLYRGEFLEGLEIREAAFEEWLLTERQRFRHMATEALATTLVRSLAACQRDRAASIARQLLLLDPYHEGACRALMQIHADRGERTQALKLYETLRRRLFRDLGVQPEPSTEALYELMRRQRTLSGAFGGAAGAIFDGLRPDDVSSTALGQSLPSGTAEAPSIAFLPFSNIGDDPEQDYFAQGLSEDIVTDLSQLSGLLTVVVLGTEFKKDRPSPQETARTMKTKYVLDGRIRKVGNRIRITTQLIEGATASCIWAERYDRDLSDVFVLQEEISKGIVEALRVRLLPDEIESLTVRPTASVEAYQLYLLGRSFYLRGIDKRSLRIARDLFTKACEIDPLYARAHAARATCDSSLCGNDPTVTFESILSGSERAIELGPELGDARAAKGLALYVSGRYPEAMVQFDQAMSLDPDLFEAHFFKARCCRLLRQRETAIALFESAADLRPDDYRCAGLLAEEYRAIGLDQEFRSAALRSLRHATQEVRIHPDNADAWAFGSAILVELGENLRGEEWASRAAIISPDDYLVHYNVSRTYSLLGRSDTALEWLECALAALPMFRRRLLAWMPLDQAFDPLRGHPKFRELVGGAADAAAASSLGMPT
jgi:TolB-like protein/DNA-binding SARP family transcriptional activator